MGKKEIEKLIISAGNGAFFVGKSNSQKVLEIENQLMLLEYQKVISGFSKNLVTVGYLALKYLETGWQRHPHVLKQPKIGENLDYLIIYCALRIVELIIYIV